MICFFNYNLKSVNKNLSIGFRVAKFRDGDPLYICFQIIN